MQACEVCGWDTRAGARVCWACRLERDEHDVDTTTAGADPNGSSLLRDLLSASDERAAAGGTATAVRALHDDGAGTAPPAEPPHGNGTAGTAAPSEPAEEPAEEPAGPVEARPSTAAGPDTAAATEAAAEDDGRTPAGGEPAAVAPAAAQDEHRPAQSEGDRDATPASTRERLRAAFRRAGGWTGAAQFGLLLVGMLCVFQIVVLIVVNRFLSQTGSATVTTADALAAHAKVTGTMFPALAVFALIVAVFASARSMDDSGRGGIHRRIAGLPSTLWAIVAAATAFLTMGLLDATGTAAQARDVTMRAMIVCAVLGVAAFVAPRGFAAPDPVDDDAPGGAPRTSDGRPPAADTAPADASRQMLARAAPEAGAADGSGPADGRR